jgi:hypothetical protein
MKNETMYENGNFPIEEPYFKFYIQPERSKREDIFIDAFCTTEIDGNYEKFKTSPLRKENCIFESDAVL